MNAAQWGRWFSDSGQTTLRSSSAWLPPLPQFSLTRCERPCGLVTGFREERSYQTGMRVESRIACKTRTSGTWWVDLKVLSDQANVPSRSFSISFEMSWRLKKVSDNWRKANFAPIFKTWQPLPRETMGQLASLLSLGKSQREFSKHILGQVREKKEIGISQHRYTKGKIDLWMRGE